jgi:hypothetical protein
MSPNLVQPDGRALDLKPVRWSSVSAAGRQVTVQYTSTGLPGCHVLGRVDVVETPAAVTITLLVGRLPNQDCSGAQPQLAASFMTVASLSAPVGTRNIHDGAAR